MFSYVIKMIMLTLTSLCVGGFVQADTAFSHQLWDQLLHKHVVMVNQGVASQVDYAGMQQDSTRLEEYLNQLSAIGPEDFDSWTADEQLAFLINAYNAWTVQLILTEYPDINSIKEIGSWFSSPWSITFIPLLGKQRSLDDIEHEMIRGEKGYHEPRIHFAVNCASIGCPALRPEAYQGNKLDRQLELATRLFLEDRSRNYYQGNSLYVSKVFKWYQSDFKQGWRGTQNTEQFLALYSTAFGLDQEQKKNLSEGQMEITYTVYDWQLNRTP